MKKIDKEFKNPGAMQIQINNSTLALSVNYAWMGTCEGPIFALKGFNYHYSLLADGQK